MSGKGLERLQRLLAERYESLRVQVARRLGGSADMASDALHDAYLRVSTRKDLDDIQYPQTYLVNAAVNSAIDQMRKDVRLVSDDEIESIFEQARSDAPGPEQTLLGRERTEQVVQILESLPLRQTQMLISHRVHGEDTTQLAQRWGMSSRMVRREIQKANDACMQALQALDKKNELP